MHMTARSTISFPGAKVNALESLVNGTSQVQAQSHVAEATQDCTSLTSLVNELRVSEEAYMKSESENVCLG